MQTTSNYGFRKPEGTDVVNVDDLNYNADQIDTALTPTADLAQVPTGNGPGKLVQWVSWIANRIKTITGKANWWEAPDVNLAMLAVHKNRHAIGGIDQLTPMDIGAASGADFTAHLVDNTKHVTKDGTLQAGLNADKLDGYDASAFATSDQGTLATNAMPKSGGTFTGVAVAQNNTTYTTKQVRNITLSTADPSGGSNGDVWFKYV